MAKNLFITYILWLIGGWVGLHHFYLKRDRHAFIWWATAGGIFGLGWFRDLWRIPEYVANSNENPDYMEELTSRMRRRSAPAFCFTRFAGQIAVGMLFGMLSLTAIPEEWTKIINSFNLFLPLAIALGEFNDIMIFPITGSSQQANDAVSTLKQCQSWCWNNVEKSSYESCLNITISMWLQRNFI